MRWLFTFLILFGANVAFAFDGEATSQNYYVARSECRIGETQSGESLSQDEISTRCNEAEKLGKSLEDNGYCWNNDEQEWSTCE